MVALGQSWSRLTYVLKQLRKVAGRAGDARVTNVLVYKNTGYTVFTVFVP